MSRQLRCPACTGDGYVYQSASGTCGTCQGRGRKEPWNLLCVDCSGSGSITEHYKVTCRRCNGAGIIHY